MKEGMKFVPIDASYFGAPRAFLMKLVSKN